MQRKFQEKESSNSQNIMATILQSIPKEANLTKIEYEGPRIALYTNSPRYLLENNDTISNLVNIIKKRIVIRTDESIRKPEDEARKIITDCVPEEANLQGTIFDTATGEVSVEAKRPWLLQRNAKEFNHAEVTEKTGWKIRVRKATTVPSRTIQTIKATLKQSSTDRSRQLREIGDEIFRPRLAQRSEVSLFTLGGFGQVGRSSMLLSTPESKILIDCGVNPGAKSPMDAYPRLDSLNMTLDDLDAVATDSVWQEAMFHCFNEAAESNVLFVVTASRAPRDLDLSLADLRSRMQKGLIFQLQAADDGFKKQILQHRANSRGISLSDQVCDYILQRADRSLAGLIAVLERLDSESFQRQRRLTVPLVKDVMGW